MIPAAGLVMMGLLFDAWIARQCCEVYTALVHSMVTVMTLLVYLEVVMNPCMFLTFLTEFGTVAMQCMWAWWP
jgi:hypothetical protein